MSDILPILNSKSDLSRIFSRTQTENGKINDKVKEIVAAVKKNGDEALFAYTKQFDAFDLSADNIQLSEREIDEAVKAVPDAVLQALRRAKENILAYHRRQMPQDDFKMYDKTGFIFRPVTRAGIYIPGGKAAYPSSVLMCALPAVVAGVDEIVMVTPPGKYCNPLTIAAAKECGIRSIYRIGGAQAIAALAFGTESIPRADVITGPGNIYVAAAKKEIFGAAGIDMIAGPSEILIIADSSANPDFIAADLLSQAEHDELAQSILITTDRVLAEKVLASLKMQLEKLPRKAIAEASLQNYGAIILCENLDEAIALSNRIAPEHLELCVKEYHNFLKNIKNAGAIFLGNYSPEPLGDYFAGTNHVLPTSGTARFSSGLGVSAYLKRIGIVQYSRRDLEVAANDIALLANTEELTAHANSVTIRIKK